MSDKEKKCKCNSPELISVPCNGTPLNINHNKEVEFEGIYELIKKTPITPIPINKREPLTQKLVNQVLSDMRFQSSVYGVAIIELTEVRDD